MPVQRFRSIDEMNAAPILTRTGDPFERFLRHCARYRTLAPKTYPRGVFKFRTLPAAQAARARGDSAPGQGADPAARNR